MHVGRWPFDEKPLLVFWETTKACLLVCKHCRAKAIREPLPGELDTREGKRLIEMVAEFGRPYPILVFTGGDPLMRKDVWELLEYAKSLGLRVGLAPSITPLLTPENIKRIARVVDAVSISLDAPSPAIHDAIRGYEGIWGKTIEVIKRFIEEGVRVQVNTVVLRETAPHLADMAKLLVDLGVKTWEVFYLVPVGRANLELMPTPSEFEDVSHFLYEASKYGILVRTTEGPMFRRVAWTRRALEEKGLDPDEVLKPGPLYQKLVARLRELLGEPRGQPLAQTVGTRDGKGIIFIGYDGRVYPSGFMEYHVGSIREKSLKEIYQEHPLLRKIRAAEFKGRCGLCEFRDICGGSRARAYHVTGDPLGEDPACPYQPGEYTKLAEKLSLPLNPPLKPVPRQQKE
ncbi:Radical SAM domain protein [Pyrolobus fumarii 1A]|uniref:Radical SAM domain protein n=1 Tax=Pyrolobus fumarii (strain DSM 11204 / 1A) TaxID=694429 RepID=G0EGZ5_PYRF1|nr:TIGR04053 family radical SAM/SPASM domain-containing protein [Pyrolobus fumarii]AEM38445.1 Radical SAM domain protein [Pyrolobus fumarii 1A]